MAEAGHPRSTPTDLRAVGDRIDALLDASSASGAHARERSEELVRLVADLYGAGLERMLEILYEAGHLDDGVLTSFARDDLVASLLLVHGLHPYGVEQRVEEALDTVRPYLGSHGGDVELLAVTESTVRLRLLGSCDGCPSSSVTLQLAVEGAIEAAAPEISAIEVETPANGRAGPLISVESLRSHLREGEASSVLAGSWQPVPALADLPPGGVTDVLVQQTPIVGCRIGSELYAFHNHCARCDSTLTGSTLARRLGGGALDALLTCPSCQAHYDVRRAGSCVDVPGLHLDPLPLLTHDGVASVAVPAPVTA
ncbi:MAG TPA: NifU family protein [Jiangellales bacterium]|nr:NifU family protein [Jiangellales bacterium]